MSAEKQPPKRRARTIARETNPDAFLQRLIDLAAAEVRRLEQKLRSNSPACAACGGGGELTKEERKFITDTTKELRMVAFGARKLLNDRHLRKLAEGQLDQLDQAIEGETEWLPSD